MTLRPTARATPRTTLRVAAPMTLRVATPMRLRVATRMALAVALRTAGRFGLPVAGCVLLALAACFSEDPAAVDDECTSFASDVTVEIQDYRFVPATACVASGGTVTWVNRGAELHTTTGAAPGLIWDSGMLANGADFAHTFETAGSFAYFCIPHPFMEARVIVQ